MSEQQITPQQAVHSMLELGESYQSIVFKVDLSNCCGSGGLSWIQVRSYSIGDVPPWDIGQALIALSRKVRVDYEANKVYPYMACPRAATPMDPLEGCSVCRSVGYHNSVPDPRWGATKR